MPLVERWDDIPDTAVIDTNLMAIFTPFFRKECEWAVVHYLGNPDSSDYTIVHIPQDERIGVDHWVLHVIASGPSIRESLTKFFEQNALTASIDVAMRTDADESFVLLAKDGEVSRNDFGALGIPWWTNPTLEIHQDDGSYACLTPRISAAVFVSYASMLSSQELGNSKRSAILLGEEQDPHFIIIEDRSCSDLDAAIEKWADITPVLTQDGAMQTARMHSMFDARLLTA